MYPGELKALIKENEQTSGLFLTRIRQLSLVDFVLEFNRKRNIFISLNNEAPFIEFNAELSKFPSGGELHSFAIDLRRFLGGRLTKITQPQNDMIIALQFTRLNNVLEPENFTLFLELIPRHPQAVLIDENNTILAAYRYNHERGKDGRLIRRGQRYNLPKKLDKITEAVYKNITRLDTYLKEYGERIKKQNYREVYVYLEHNIKRLKRLVNNFKLDLKKLDALPKLYNNASLLLTEKPRINGEFVEIYDEIIKVDPRYDAVTNAELIFKRAKKIKKSEEILKQKIVETKERISYYDSILSHLRMNDDAQDITQIYEELNIEKLPNKKRVVSKLMPYYIEYNNTLILFGKNNQQNDRLTFKIARKNDTFMHIRNHPGAHIIIQAEKPGKDVLEFAANLALYLSKKVDGEVTFTPVNKIKKGPHLGQVILLAEHTLFIRYNDKLTTLFDQEIKRYL